MNNLVLLAVYDRVTHTYGNFFVAVNKEDGIRRWRSAFAQSPYKSDMDLFFLGEISPETGNIHDADPVFVEAYPQESEK